MLLESVSWDLDYADVQPMNSWEFLSNYFLKRKYVRLLFALKNYPIIGKFARNTVFSQLSFGYDVISCYIRAHEHVEHKIHELVNIYPKKIHIK